MSECIFDTDNESIISSFLLRMIVQTRQLNYEVMDKVSRRLLLHEICHILAIACKLQLCQTSSLRCLSCLNGIQAVVLWLFFLARDCPLSLPICRMKTGISHQLMRTDRKMRIWETVEAKEQREKKN